MSLYYQIKRRIFPAGALGYTPQFRLEARARDEESNNGLAMRVADPLWMLGRQWQFGEFRAEDNGSPISVKASYRTEKPQFYSFSENGQPQPLGQAPLEGIVEAMKIQPKDLRSKVRIGQKLEELIREAFDARRASELIQQLRTEYPLTKEDDGQFDDRSRRFFKLMAGNVIDGGDLWKSIQEERFLKDDFAALNTVVSRLQNWYAELFLLPVADEAWLSNRLFHRFELHHREGNQNDVTLSAPDYQSGHLDWYSFDKAAVNIDPKKNPTQIEGLTPINASFAAMPDKRLFSFEDSQMDFAGMNVDTSDLVRLMLIDFSLVSGSDWYTIPIEMALGELCWINHLEVKDVFGVTTIIYNDKDTGQFLSEDALKVWDVFKIRGKLEIKDENEPIFKAPEHFLYLAPATTFRLESKPLEELLFLRDEFANMVWAIEKTACNEMGKPIDGFDLHLELNGPFLKADDDESQEKTNVPRFRLASPVPTNWIPYLPFHVDDQKTQIELRRAVMMRNEDRNDDKDEPKDITPLTTLANKDILSVREEAIPRAGVRIQVTKQRVRWTDGKTYIWMGRKVLAGKGEGSSDLTFDQLT